MTNAIVKNEDSQLSNTFNVPTGFVNTLDLETDEGKNLALKAYGSADSLNNHVGEVLKISDVMTMPGIRKGRNGQNDKPCQNTYLIDTEGNAYFTQSDGVANSLQMFVALYPEFGKSTAEGYIALSCVERPMPNGNTLKTLVPAK